MAVEFDRLNVGSGYNPSKINTNFQRIDEALQDAISRSGDTPNTMEASFDMNGHDVLNAGVINAGAIMLNGEPITPSDSQVGDINQLIPYGRYVSFGTRAEAISYAPSVALDWIKTEGYTTVGDNGGALYKKVGSQPSHSGKFQTSSGTWYEIYEQQVTPQMFGAVADGTTDCTTAVQAAIDMVSARNGGVVFFPPSANNYNFTDTIRIKRRVKLKGPGFASTATADRIATLMFTNTGSVKECCIIADGPTDSVGFAVIEGLIITGTASKWNHFIKMNVTHWSRIEDNYITGTPVISLVWYGACLYVTLKNNLISSSSMVPIGVSALETNAAPTGYYGINVGEISNNNFFIPGTAIAIDGICEIRNNDIESSASDGVPKITTGTTVSSSLIIVDNYCEVALSGSPLSTNLSFFKSKQSNRIVAHGNTLYGPNTGRGDSLAFDFTGVAAYGSIYANGIFRWGHIYGVGSSSSDISVYDNRTVGTGDPIGNARAKEANVGSTSIAPYFLRDNHDIVTEGAVVRQVPQAPASVAATHLSNGNVIYSTITTPTWDLIDDAGLFPGAEVILHTRSGGDTVKHNISTSLYTIYMREKGRGYTTASVSITGGGGSGATATANIVNGYVDSITITNAGSGFTGTPTVSITGDGTGATARARRKAPFYLIKGADCTLTARDTMRFVVMGPDLALYEIGDLSVRR